ncbi:MAG TPA: hypothetical protein VMH32_20775 [Burkholderiales bacterium]|nr:hypothetical protein [Burkholderiales bacterium]
MTRVGIAVALRAEASSLVRRRVRTGAVTPVASGALLAVSGMGPARTLSSGRMLLEAGASALLSWGSASALDPTLRPGSAVLPEEVIGSDGRRITVSGDWHERVRRRLGAELPTHISPLTEAPTILATREQKLDLARERGATAADMESAALARLAQRACVPFLAVRAIADGCDMRLPAWLVETLDEFGRPRAAGFCSGLLRHPADVGALTRLARGFHAATVTLSLIHARAGSELFSPA